MSIIEETSKISKQQLPPHILAGTERREGDGSSKS
jgi:hypothetical protein